MAIPLFRATLLAPRSGIPIAPRSGVARHRKMNLKRGSRKARPPIACASRAPFGGPKGPRFARHRWTSSGLKETTFVPSLWSLSSLAAINPHHF